MTDRVRQEVAIHSRLKHPSILELFTFFEDSNFVYLVLELAHNGALQRFLMDKQKTLSEFEAANILAQVVDGLQYLHSNHIMHRDMSMSNLLLTATMHVKIADFGLATQLDQHFESKHTTLCGTPNYISPEVASRSAHGLPTDVWGLGCLLYTLLVGRPPFDTNGVKSTLTQVVIGNFSIPEYISAEARDLIQRLLCKDPTKRIRLNEVILHPFMMMKNQQVVTIDSGIMSHRSARSRSEERSMKQHHLEQQVVGSASMYRCFSSLSINQQPYSTSINQQQQINYGSSIHQQPMATPPYHKPQSLLQLTPPEPAARTIDVPPLSSARLQPTRHKTKSAILSIIHEPPGEVVIEFIKYKAKYGEERVNDVCRISSDGLRIVLYQPNHGKGTKVENEPPELPLNGADHIYSYENLPEKHWKKYMYAHRFIQMVRAKTPKVTFYSELAKCQLMENLEDFEMCLYKGGKVTKTGSSHEFQLQIESSSLNAMSQERNFIQHAEKCYQHCVKIEQTMSLMALDFPCFPIIIGRRPVDQSSGKEIRKDNTFNNYISSSQTPIRTPKINMPSFNVEQTPSPSLRLPVLGLNNHRVLDTPLNHGPRRTAVPGIGSAVHLPNGTVEIQYFDGSQISALTPDQGGGILFMSSTGKGIQPIHYNENDLMPDIVRAKFKQLPVVLKHLMHRDGEIITSTPTSSPAVLSNRFNHMKFIR